MNKLEKELCSATEVAWTTYFDRTDYWLWHAPEHFLQNAIFMKIGKYNRAYLEATRKKITKLTEEKYPGRPTRRRTQRYDLVIWQKSYDQLRAVVEIKKHYSAGTQVLTPDRNKLTRATRGNGANAARAGYLLVYSEAQIKNGTHSLHKRFRSWACNLRLELCHSKILSQSGTDEHGKPWACGFCLLRAPRGGRRSAPGHSASAR